MPVEMGMWRIDGDTPKRLAAAALPSEATLEQYLEKDPSLLGERLLVIGRQVRTPHGKLIDLLAMDVDGNLHVLELKREKTPRDVVAQVLDYGSWASTLNRDAIIDLANDHLDEPFEAAYDAVFGGAPPDELNAQSRLTIVATDLDPGSERIVTYLRTFGVPVNAVFFSYLEEEGRRYLTRSWLAQDDERDGPLAAYAKSKRGKRAVWNGRDWYVSFGDGLGRSWEDGLRYGFVSAGGGDWYSKTIRALPEGARVNVYVRKRGYVAVGTTLGPAVPFPDARVLMNGSWVRLGDQPLVGPYEHEPSDDPSEDVMEYVVPVAWLDARPLSRAYREPGLFASQHSACKLRQEFTLERLAEHFGLDD
ncbi:MAG: DUF91 domain-containing protein [Dermatophilaceae bacterium]|jgi:hypothetical protein|nr:DUF91 domain-containing protein [Dermatophilaceae bacterium]MBP9919850.1 DUF91 domain-containing protein [Dermatophilaceae bacterium]